MNVGETAEGKKKGPSDEGKDTGGPGLGAFGNIEGLGDIGEDNIESRDEEFLSSRSAPRNGKKGSNSADQSVTNLGLLGETYSHKHGNQQGATEQNLVGCIFEDGRPLAAKLIEVDDISLRSGT